MRVVVLGGSILLGMSILLWGLWSIQVRKGEHFYVLSEENRIKHIPLRAPRGYIYDRNHKILARNRPEFNVYMIPEELRRHPLAIQHLSELLDIPLETIWEAIRKYRYPGFVPVQIKRDINSVQLAMVEEQSMHLPGVYVDVASTREYVYGPLAAHVVGYVGEINADELTNMRPYGYSLGDVFGKYGVEYMYERYLKGERGGKQVEVTASGREKRRLSYKAPVKGNDVVLTIDVDVQQALEAAMEGHAGAAIVMNPLNGEVLGMVSNPSFDPNVFTDLSRREELRSLLKESDAKPLLNRAITSQYSPGSIFKIIMGVAGLAEKAITRYSSYYCSGSFTLGRVFHCWNKNGHSTVNLENALKTSCNIFFYRLGLKIEADALVKYCRLFGLGRKTGIELLGEKPGFVPTRKWKKNRYGEPWYPGETANFSIGQGYMLVTPIQLISAINAVINGGTWFEPRLVRSVLRSDGDVLKPEVYSDRSLKIDDSFLSVARKGMWLVVNDPYGTGQKARLDQVQVAGKTGTVQVVGRETKEDLAGELPDRYKNHAWFVGYAPYNKPEYSVVVFLEHGESGGQFAAPVGGDILKRIFDAKAEVAA